MARENYAIVYVTEQLAAQIPAEIARYKDAPVSYTHLDVYKRQLHDILKGIAVVLAVLVVLTLALLLWGQRFLVFTDRGPRLNLPGFSGGGETPPAASGSISVVIDLSLIHI